jgi:cyclopropane-fatty-acyl-phospholipid synthase
MSYAARFAIDWIEQGYVPDAVIRRGIHRLCEQRLRELGTNDCQAALVRSEVFLRYMETAQLALLPHLANAQHYELPAEFFGLVLGPHRKYSCAWWPSDTLNLAQAETNALTATCECADIADGQDVLELGCGWGSLALWMAVHYPSTRITSVSNSHSQRTWIVGEANRLGLKNLEILTCDMNEFEIERRFDRIVSVEMFEHMRNWRLLFKRVHNWLRPGGRFFVHVFCHRSTPYAFADDGPSDWMSRHFFSGGMMPSDDLALRFQDHLRLIGRWRWDGTHYEETANAWLGNLDARRKEALPILRNVYGDCEAERWLQRWRIFFMACAETFGYRKGQEWWVSQYLFERPSL